MKISKNYQPKFLLCFYRFHRKLRHPPPHSQAPARGAVGSLPPASAVATHGQDPRELSTDKNWLPRAASVAGRGLAAGFRERAPAPYPLGALAPLAQQPTAVRAPAHRKKWTNRRPGSGATRKPRHHTQRRKVAVSPCSVDCPRTHC